MQVAGPVAVASYLQLSFPAWRISGLQPPRQPPFDWLVAMLLPAADLPALQALLSGLQDHYLLAAGDAGALQALWALEPHGEYRGEFHFSPGGAAIVDTKHGMDLGPAEGYWWPRLSAFVDSQPLLRFVQAVTWVPSGEQAAGRLRAAPTLAERLAVRLAARYGWEVQRLRLRTILAQKGLEGPLERLINLEGALELEERPGLADTPDPQKCSENQVGPGRPPPRLLPTLVLDDVVFSGASVRQAGYLLHRLGAPWVVALALTRAYPHRKRLSGAPGDAALRR